MSAETSTEQDLEELQLVCEFLVKEAASKNTVLRAAVMNTVNAVLRWTTTASVSAVPPCVVEMIQTLLDRFIHKKKSAPIPAKLFEGLMERHAVFAVTNALMPLVDGAQTAKDTFIRSECFRLISILLRRHQTLTAEGVTALLSKANAVANMLVQTRGLLQKSSSSSDGSADTSGDSADTKRPSRKSREDQRAKRLKPICACLREFCALLRFRSREQVFRELRQTTVAAVSAMEDLVTELTAEGFVPAAGAVKSSALQAAAQLKNVEKVVVVEEVQAAPKSAKKSKKNKL